MSQPVLYFVTPGTTPRKNVNGEYEHCQNIAVLGTFLPLTKADLIRYVRRYPLHWVIA